jgi:hypothetical protein
LVHGVSGALRDGGGRSLEGEDAGGRVGGGGSGVVGMAVEALGAVEAVPATEGELAGDAFGIDGVRVAAGGATLCVCTDALKEEGAVAA